MSQSPAANLLPVALVLAFAGLAFGFTIAVVVSVLRRSGKSHARPVPPGMNLEDECSRELAAHGKLAAIKLYRERTGFGLREAKDAIELIEAAGAPVGALPSVAPAEGNPTAAEIGRLVAAGRKIEAIKLYRESTGCDLRAAKSAIDAVEAGLKH